MAKGIIYIMTTSVKGLIKIGKTNDFKNRINKLEQDGYWNVSGLHLYYAVKVNDYDEKERLIHTIFSKSQVSTSELFALDKELAKELLDSFDGEIVFPTTQQQTIPAKDQKVKSAKLTFSRCGIPIGSTLVYTKDTSIKVKTINDTNQVSYKGKSYSISGLARELTGYTACQGGQYFTYKGTKLTDINK